MKKKLDIGIVTTVWGDYGKYLPDWTNSICNQTLKPAIVTLVVAGKTPNNAPRIWQKQCIPALEAARIPCQIRILPKYINMGHTRNQAVEITDTEWIMHLDVDDILLPWCLSDVAEVADEADVVAVGVRLEKGNGELIKEKVYIGKISPTIERVTKNKDISRSQSPFRKSFWKKRPYLELNDYVVDVLYTGFIYLGARFIGTPRVSTVWKRRKGSNWDSKTKKQKLEAKQQTKMIIENPDYFYKLHKSRNK